MSNVVAFDPSRFRSEPLPQLGDIGKAATWIEIRLECMEPAERVAILETLFAYVHNRLMEELTK